MSRLNVVFFLTIYIALLISAFVLPGTGGDGDSVSHYLYAKHAFDHPELFFNHWAKPLFVLLTSPFAQLGFIGVKIMNVSLSMGAMFILFMLAKYERFKYPLILPLFYLLFPLNLVLMFSGLTEPMFAFFLILAVFFALKKKLILATLLISLLPFIRSEGLIVILVFGAYLVFIKKWRMLPLLLAGHLVYGLAGLVQYDTILWTFTEIPYTDQGGYGHGRLQDFIFKLLYVLGVPLYLMFWLGIVSACRQLIQTRLKSNIESNALVLGLVMAYVSAHSLFWWLGLFHSMGLNRVLIAIGPLLAILSYKGFILVYNAIPVPLAKKIWFAVAVGYALIFPFTSNPAGIKLKDFYLSETQVAMDALAKEMVLTTDSSRLYYHAPYLSVAFNRDPFDSRLSPRTMDSFINGSDAHGALVWDWWFSEKEGGLSLAYLKGHQNLKEVNRVIGENGQPLLVIFEKHSLER
jgi:hypothetical protein